MTEQTITSLKWLIENCRRSGLDYYADILDDACFQCLQYYIADQREKLADKLSRGTDNQEHLN